MPKNHLSPHDRYIRSILSNTPVAREFFEKHLPPEVIKTIDFSTLEVRKDSFINDKLRLQVADLLFSVNFHGDPGYIYLLLEHASTPDRLLPYRMLQYTLSIMEHHLKKSKKKKLPLVVPLILYTGNKPYTYSTDFFELFEKEKELARSTFLNPYQIIDLNKIPDETLRDAYYWFGAAALTAKHIRDFDLVSLVKSMVNLLDRLKKDGFDNYVHLTLSYIFTTGEVKDEEGFRDVIRSGLSSSDEEIVMTLAEKYRQKGYQEGKRDSMIAVEQYIQKGKLEALYETALNLFKLGMSAAQVVQATGLSLQEVRNLSRQNVSSKH